MVPSKDPVVDRVLFVADVAGRGRLQFTGFSGICKIEVGPLSVHGLISPFAGILSLFGACPGTSDAWWVIQHHIGGIFFALVFAWPVVYTRFPGWRMG